MPLNPKGNMFSFNGDILGMVAAERRCWGEGLPGSVSCAALFSGPSPRPPSSRPHSPRLPLLCSQAGQPLVNLIEGFVLSVLARQLGESPAWELADILRQPGPG